MILIPMAAGLISSVGLLIAFADHDGGSASAPRFFSADSVAPGGELVVAVAASDYDFWGEVTETLPDGFTYASTDLSDGAETEGQTATFTPFEVPQSFT